MTEGPAVPLRLGLSINLSSKLLHPPPPCSLCLQTDSWGGLRPGWDPLLIPATCEEKSKEEENKEGGFLRLSFPKPWEPELGQRHY